MAALALCDGERHTGHAAVLMPLPNHWVLGTDPGQFATSLHVLMVDWQGNLYTGEAAAAGRIQKFRLR